MSQPEGGMARNNTALAKPTKCCIVPLMRLSEYLDRLDISHKEFAARIGTSAEAVRLLARGDRRPRQATLDAIIRETGGKVRIEDFYGPAEPAKGHAA